MGGDRAWLGEVALLTIDRIYTNQKRREAPMPAIEHRRFGLEHCMTDRRSLLLGCGAATIGLALNYLPLRSVFAAPAEAEVLPWLDQPTAIPERAARVVGNLQRWEDLTSWITPNQQFFSVAHYGVPSIDLQNWSLEISGLVHRPRRYTLAELKARPRQEVTFTVECSGDRGLPFLQSAIGNARWAGTPLARVLAEAQPLKNGIEVVFIGGDAGEETVRDVKFTSNFARGMSLAEAMEPKNLLCYEMNGAPLPTANGAPLRLITPGWYGIANVKWLKRIEVRETRYAGRFMGRDYVTLREEQRDGEKFWAETLVGRWRINSAPARVVKQGSQYRIVGAAWGAPIARVEVQVDGGKWIPARIEQGSSDGLTWKFWSLDWPSPSAGEHSIASRAVDTSGNIQPSIDDPVLAGKKTYWESNGQAARRVRIT
jgi:DMSO/TMAO reductase YedYZ molybdopterin-dependent catalytic subunit